MLSDRYEEKDKVTVNEETRSSSIQPDTEECERERPNREKNKFLEKE